MDIFRNVNKTLFQILFIISSPLLFVGIIVINEKVQPMVYGRTYYAALPLMFEKMAEAEGKKIVLIGNSAVAFGVNEKMLEEILKNEDYDYEVCNFGLYGAIGSAAMLDLAEEEIKEGDIVVYMPEASVQAQSLYFSAIELWYSLEGGKELIWNLDGDHFSKIAAEYFNYVAVRKKQKSEINPLGIYALSSFDENANLVNYSRKYNIMEDGTDTNNMVNLDEICPDSAYFEFVNNFYEKVKQKGAQMYFVYAPVNCGALQGDIDAYCERMADGYEFPVAGCIQNSIMDSEWFYDSNFHLNESGAAVFTILLADTLKTRWGDDSVTEISLPEKPSGYEEKNKNLNEKTAEYDNTDEDCFIYEETDAGFVITGLNETGMEKGELTVPGMHNGKTVTGIRTGTFRAKCRIRKIIFQQNIKRIPDYLFEECSELKEIILAHASPQDISVGYHLLAGTEAYIYVSEEAEGAFKNNYFWGYYAEKIKKYE